MRTSQSASETKFIRTFVRSSFKLENEEYLISTRALKLLVPNYFKQHFTNTSVSFVAIRDLSDEVNQSLFGGEPSSYLDRFFTNKKKQHDADDDYVKSIKHDLKFALSQCVLDYKKHYYDYLSYRLSEQKAKLKAETLCLMRVIKRFLETNDRTELLYEVFMTLECKGAIKCKTAKEFYKHVDMLIRSGIYQGVLLDK